MLVRFLMSLVFKLVGVFVYILENAVFYFVYPQFARSIFCVTTTCIVGSNVLSTHGLVRENGVGT